MALIVIANEKSFLFFRLTFQAQQNLIGIGILGDEHSVRNNSKCVDENIVF
jgi:hypothetical protein